MSTPACLSDVARFWSLSLTLQHKSNTRAALVTGFREPQFLTIFVFENRAWVRSIKAPSSADFRSTQARP